MNEEKYNVNFGEYEVAAALYGSDVIKIFSDKDTLRGNILLVDPMGHDPKKSKQVSSFLEREIKKGEFGSSQDPATEFLSLSRSLYKSECPEFTAAYAQLPRGNEILIVNAALPIPIKFKAKDNSIHYLKDLEGTFCFPMYITNPPQTYKIEMMPKDLLILTTDGIWDNIEPALGWDKKNTDNIQEKHREIITKRNKLLEDFFKSNSNKSAYNIINTFTKTLGPIVSPKTKDDDDASIVVIKRN